MVVNEMRGDVAIVLNDTEHVMRLTLGALVELEMLLASDGLVDLVGRFERLEFSTQDVLALLYAGLVGGGWQGSLDDLKAAQIHGGVSAATQAAALLLVRSFGPCDD